MEPEISLPHSQQPSTCACSEPYQSSPRPYPTYWSAVLILSSHPRLGLKWALSLRFSHQNPLRTSPRPHTCYTPRPSHSSWFDHPNSIWWAVQIVKCWYILEQNSLMGHCMWCMWLSAYIRLVSKFLIRRDKIPVPRSDVCCVGKCILSTQHCPTWDILI